MGDIEIKVEAIKDVIIEITGITFIFSTRSNSDLFRSNKHNGQSKSQPTLITQTRSLESSESSSKPTEDASEILKEITAKTEEISLTK